MSLGGVTVKVKDSAGVERLAPLFYVSPTQVNYLVPTGTANGIATVTIGSASGMLPAANIAPGLYTASQNGSGPAAANVVVTHSDGSQTVRNALQCDTAGLNCTTAPIDLSSSTDQVALVL